MRRLPHRDGLFTSQLREIVLQKESSRRFSDTFLLALLQEWRPSELEGVTQQSGEDVRSRRKSRCDGEYQSFGHTIIRSRMVASHIRDMSCEGKQVHLQSWSEI